METNVDHIVVEPRPDGRWARQPNGTKRAASLHDTQAEAEAAARREAKRMHTELVVRGPTGRFSGESYGGDPSRRPGRHRTSSPVTRRGCTRGPPAAVQQIAAVLLAGVIPDASVAEVMSRRCQGNA